MLGRTLGLFDAFLKYSESMFWAPELEFWEQTTPKLGSVASGGFGRLAAAASGKKRKMRISRSSVASGGFGRLAAATRGEKKKKLDLPEFGRDHVARGG